MPWALQLSWGGWVVSYERDSPVPGHVLRATCTETGVPRSSKSNGMKPCAVGHGASERGGDNLKSVEDFLPLPECLNLALTALYVPCSLNFGLFLLVWQALLAYRSTSL